MIKITFPDKKVKEYEVGVSGLDIAKSISNSLAKEVVAVSVNGELWDANRPIEQDATIKLHKFEDNEGKHAFWHSSAHLMAQALEHLYPGIKLWVGPALENGYYYDVDLPEGKVISDADFPKIEAEMKKLAQENNAFVCKEMPKNEALSYYKEKGDEYKIDLIERLEDGRITFYSQGDFADLCKGPHLPSTKFIKAVKVLSVAGAYWKGNENNKQLTRIYGISFPKQTLLDDYLKMLEEAKQRDHRKIGKELELFMFSQQVGLGLPMWLPRGTDLRQRLIDLLKKVHKKYDYQHVVTPHIGHKNLYITSGHYEKYGQDSFKPIQTPAEGEEFLIKPMNCPHHCEIYRAFPHSYKDLPIRMAEFGTVYRYEQSGEVHGLTRVRGFTQDDAHIFCTPNQLKDEFKKVIDIIMYLYKVLDFEDYEAQISLRDKKNTEKYIGSDENWDKAEQAIIEAAAEKGLNTYTEEGEAAFYGPKLDFMVKDAIGRKWQLSTIQVDYNLPERFKLEYVGEDNQKHQPVMIHRAPYGSLDRFIAVLIEHTAGKFPLWLTPDQVVILPISEKFNDYAKKVSKFLNNCDIRSLIDNRNEKIGKKIRDNELKRIPYLLIVGENEMNNNTVSVRRQGEGDKGSMQLEAFAEFLNQEVEKQLAI
jgi:threonyl-tRNA synthetase